MRRLILQMGVTLDGYVAGRGGEGDWGLPPEQPDVQAWKVASLRQVGLDPSSDWLPIAPAAHYLSGGIVTDLDGGPIAGAPLDLGHRVSLLAAAGPVAHAEALRLLGGRDA